MLSIIDRIEIAIACNKGNRQFKKELRAYDRAAGVNKNNADNKSDSDNTTATTEKKPNGFFVNLFGNKGKDKNAETPAEEQKTEVQTEEQKTEVQTEEQKSEVRTEEQIYAEAEAPVEEAGAEVITGEVTTEQPDEATMSGATVVDPNKAGVIDFSQFGFTVDTVAANKGLNGGPTSPFPGQVIPVANPSIQQPVESPNTAVVPNQMIPAQPTANPAMQFQMPGIPNMDTYAQMLNQNQQPGQGRHRIDQPKPVKPPKGPKSEPDNIDIEGMPDLQKGMDVEYFPKQDVRKIGVVEDKVPMEVEKIDPKSIFPKNETLFPKYPYLQDIEKIGLENGYQIGFGVRATGLIECHVCNDNGEDIHNKGFVIDPGFIIDHRKKIFAGMYNFYEGMNAYPLFIPGNDKDGKKGSNILNADLIKGLIVGGNQTVEGAKGLYSEDFRNLNCIVALITIPTNKIGAADRKYIQNRLVTLYKSGVLTDVLSTNPGARFRVADFNKSSNTIILDTEGVPKTFGGQYVSNERIQLKVTADKCKVLRGENIIQIADNE